MKYVTNSLETSRFDLETFVTDFKTSPFTAVCSSDETEDQLDTLNKLILIVINKHAPLVKINLPDHQLP